MQTYETMKHTTWECKSHVVFITKCRKKTLSGQNPVGVGAGFPGTGAAERMRDNRRASDGRSCTQVAFDLTEKFGGAGIGVPEGENADPQSAGVCRAKAELCGTAVLGAWLPGVHGGTGRSRGASLYSGTGEGKSAGWINLMPLYQLRWHRGGSQGDSANMKAEDADWHRWKNWTALPEKFHQMRGRGSLSQMA